MNSKKGLNKKQEDLYFRGVYRVKIQQVQILVLFMAILYLMFSLILLFRGTLFKSFNYLALVIFILFLTAYLILEYRRVFSR